MVNFSAPFHTYSRFRSPKDKGCYYLLKHYENGAQVMTNEPCLNCTCTNSMLMCYLRVCPFIKPLGENCIITKNDGECCPSITCPEGWSSFFLKKRYFDALFSM